MSRLLCLAAIALLLLGAAGCDPPQEPAAHVDPAHWPEDLDDTAAKIRERFSALRRSGPADASREAAAAELLDLVTWSPELAADTDLPESRWNAIHHRVAELRPRLQASLPQVRGGEGLPEEVAGDVEALAERLEEEAARLREQAG